MPEKPESYQPTFAYPYIEEENYEITEFEYLDPLVLVRLKDAVKNNNGKSSNYLVGEDYRVRLKVNGDEKVITVPMGMMTDLASVPALFRSFIGRVGPHLEAAIVHDFLYSAWQDFEDMTPTKNMRKFSDEVMRVAMLSARVAGWKVFLIYKALRIGGKKAFTDKNFPRYVDLGKALKAKPVQISSRT